MSLRLRITPEAGRGSTTVLGERSWSVYDVKQAIMHQMGLPIRGQRLLFKGQLLHNDQTVGSFLPRGYLADLFLQLLDPERMDWMEKVEKDGGLLRHAPEEIRGDREVVAAALSGFGLALRFASDELRCDRGMVELALQTAPLALEFASVDLRSDWELVLAAVEGDMSALKFAGPAIRDDREFMLFVVERRGVLLEYASEGLRGNREIVLAAVRKDGKALRFASEALRADREIVLEALKKGRGRGLDVIPEGFREDPEIRLLAGIRDPLPARPAVEVNARSAVDGAAGRSLLASQAAAQAGPEEEEEEPEAEELGTKERIQLATHWRIDSGAPCRLVHRWAPGLALTLPMACKDCIFGRHLWCRHCGPYAMDEADVVMERIEKESLQRYRMEQDKISKSLGSGLFWTDAELRMGHFKGL